MTDEASRLDAYVEGVLAGRHGHARPVVAGDDLDPATRHAADLLARTLIRFHPSFRFEEGVAARLRTEAATMVRREAATPATPATPATMAGDAVAIERGARLIAFPTPGTAATAAHGHGLLVGGAIASGISLAGAAYLAWRRGHRVAL